MPSRFHLHILSADIDGVAGHHTIHAQIEETDEDGATVNPVPETFGISHDALQTRFNGDAEQWREWVTREMMDRHRKRRAVQAKVMEWRGKRFEVHP